jgi:hypothetical protein
MSLAAEHSVVFPIKKRKNKRIEFTELTIRIRDNVLFE